MSRKNLLQFDTTPREKPAEDTVATPSTASVEKDRDLSKDIPVNPVSRALRGIEEKAAKSDEYDEKVAAGLVIHELDHDQIELSFIKDRIDVETAAIDELKQKIAESGQISPILVRPHPKQPGRFQIVYGHRRYLATKALGIKVKAVIKSVDDRELIIAQGQENNDHLGLSFIERAQFGLNIRRLGYDMNVVMQALNANQSLAYKMIAVAEKAGKDLIAAIGAAPSIGRRKWEDLVDLIDERVSDALQFLSGAEVKLLGSDERFEALASFLTSVRQAPEVTASSSSDSNSTEVEDSTGVENENLATKAVWKSTNSNLLIQIKPKAKSFDFSLKNPDAHKFGIWLSERLGQLYDEFEKETDVK